ncbi:MAG: POTRA domain-containing protein [Pyrinomonadaceae bacterium]
MSIKRDKQLDAAGNVKSPPWGGVSKILQVAVYVVLACGGFMTTPAQTKYEKARIDKVDISFGTMPTNNQQAEQYRQIAKEALGPIYTSTRIRDAIQALYSTKKIDTITVAASTNAAGGVDIYFNIKRKTQAEKIDFIVGTTVGDRVLEQDLLFKLNLLTPGTAITEQTLRSNADEILDYLRERGFYQSEVTYERRPLQNENEVGVTFRVMPNTQVKVADFRINIAGGKKPILASELKLRKGEYFSRDRLTADLQKIRNILRKDDFIAPELDEPRVVYDSDSNSVTIDLTGKVGPTVTIKIDGEKGSKVGAATQTRLLPIKRDGTLDFAAIVEGERRLENYYQERGFFFANVTPICTVKPTLNDSENNPIANGTEFLCSFLGGEDLIGREVEVTYQVALNRRLRLSKIRITGTDKLTVEDVQTVLGSQTATVLGVVPLLGYGNGYTSETILEDDRATIQSLMAELGYRDAQVRVNQGVSPNGQDLIITFVVEEGVPTVVRDVSIVGNLAIPTTELTAELPVLTGRNYSRARMRNAVQKLSQYYSQRGYYDARVVSSVIETPIAAGADKREVNLEFKIENEGKKVRIDRILINNDGKTKTAAAMRALTFRTGDLLRAADVYSSEQNLYGTDAFSRVDIKPQPKGDAPGGERLTDVIVNLKEQPARLLSYGGGYSTDIGLNGFFDIRHVNLFGNLWQGGARVKVSQRQQLVQFDFINPRFIRDGEKKYAPLTISIQYQRDTTVTRFFRSVFDKGTFGIVQRIDANGNAIDQFGARAGSPTINRLTLSAETSRTLSRKSRSILFFRYRFEDVRLYNIESLLIKDLLRPDAQTRISGFTTTFVRDTRQNCSVKYSLLELIAKGEPTAACRYNASDPTKGDYLTADYNVSIPFLGANIGFHKFQASYNIYYTFPWLRNTTLAARALIGVGQVFSGGNRFTNAQFPSLNGLLPVSERFFAGGANSLRGFDFEEAGPRVAIVPVGSFRNSKGDPVFLPPFTVPFGGNAFAAVNLEARIPVTKFLRAVPFYDGGNVFRRAGDILKPPTVPANNVELQNQRAVWTHTVGLGFRIKTPVGGEFGVDYGRLLNPPRFLIPQGIFPNAIYQLRQDHIHFRFSQAF